MQTTKVDYDKLLNLDGQTYTLHGGGRYYRDEQGRQVPQEISDRLDRIVVLALHSTMLPQSDRAC